MVKYISRKYCLIRFCVIKCKIIKNYQNEEPLVTITVVLVFNNMINREKLFYVFLSPAITVTRVTGSHVPQKRMRTYRSVAAGCWWCEQGFTVVKKMYTVH